MKIEQRKREIHDQKSGKVPRTLTLDSRMNILYRLAAEFDQLPTIPKPSDFACRRPIVPGSSRATQAAPDNSCAFLELAGTAAALGKREEAGADFTKAKELDPQLVAPCQAPGQEQGGTRTAEAGKSSMEWVEE
jgi:hypothetical protein